MFAFGNLLTELLQGVEQRFIPGSGFDRTARPVFVAAFLGRQGKIFDLLVNGHERLLLAEKDFTS